MMGGWGSSPSEVWICWVRYVGGSVVYRDFIGAYGPAAEHAERARGRRDVANVYLLFSEENVVKMVWATEGRRVTVSEFQPGA